MTLPASGVAITGVSKSEDHTVALQSIVAKYSANALLSPGHIIMIESG